MAEGEAENTENAGVTLSVPGDWTVERLDGDPAEKARTDIERMIAVMPELAPMRDDIVTAYTADLTRMKASGTIFVAYANLDCSDGHLTSSVTVSVVPSPDTEGEDVYDWLEEAFVTDEGVMDVGVTSLPTAGRAVQVAGEEPAGNVGMQIPGVDMSDAGPLTYLRTMVPLADRLIDVYCCASFSPMNEQTALETLTQQVAESGDAAAAPAGDTTAVSADAAATAASAAHTTPLASMPDELRGEMFTFFQAMVSTLRIPQPASSGATSDDAIPIE